MDCVWFIRDHLYELSGAPNYPGAESTDLYCTFYTMHDFKSMIDSEEFFLSPDVTFTMFTGDM